MIHFSEKDSHQSDQQQQERVSVRDGPLVSGGGLFQSSSWTLETGAGLGRSQHSRGFCGGSVCTAWRMRYSVIEDGMIFQDRFLGSLALRRVGWDCSITTCPPVFFRSAWKYTGIPISRDNFHLRT